MQTIVNKRVFVNNGQRFTDPDTAMSPAGVKDLYSAMYPELLNAEIKGPEIEGDELVFTFHRTTGTKGAATTAGRRSKAGAMAKSEKSPFLRRLEIAAGETSSPTSALPALKLNTLIQAMMPAKGSPALSLQSSSFPLFL